MAQKNKSWVALIAIKLICFYQRGISPFISGRSACRFIPTCSEYAKQAIDKYGVIKGIKMTINRICRCRPGGGFGYDPVP
ncbi:MAG: membrane protein insertion efficiency factor YidD [Alphaproteobacteria bacterium]